MTGCDQLESFDRALALLPPALKAMPVKFQASETCAQAADGGTDTTEN